MPAEPIRFVKEIGMFGFSRGRQTCLWKTQWCERQCYNKKFYRVNPKLPERDALDNDLWDAGPSVFLSTMARIGVRDRFRFAVRGEIWNNREDLIKVSRILMYRSDVLFWIPTRAWQSPDMRFGIERNILTLWNARVLASIDPTVDPRRVADLRRFGWSTVFSGDNENPDQLLLAPGGVIEKRTAQMFRCEKTWENRHGHCAVCTEGCFSSNQVDVHLRQHR